MFYVNYISVRKREKEKGGWGNGNGNPLQYSCLENPRDGEAWWAAICGVTQSWTQLKRLSNLVGGLNTANATAIKVPMPFFIQKKILKFT